METYETYLNKVHKWGRIWNLSVAAILIAFPFVVALIFHVKPDGHGLILGLLSTAPVYWAVGFVETFTYIPMLGAGGSYLSFVTGNISNLKLPCALNSLEQAEVKANSDEGEVISTISIAVSSITTTIIIFLGVLLIRPLTPILQKEALAPAFENLVPALFGGLAVVFISRSWKIAVAPAIVMLILFIFIPALNAHTVGVVVPFSVLFTLGVSRLMYKKGLLD
ncbi:MAG: hypothetical protein PQJ46_00330 [Spirochaetales bacterium]|nr:hypothetical protein [Spirochaetales bacterium]